MNPPSVQDLSLYELALSSQQPPQPLQVSPATLKSMVEATIDVLIEQQIPATLLAKLPQAMVWQEDLARYHQLDIAGAIYVCHTPATSLDNQTDEAILKSENLSHPSDRATKPATGHLPNFGARSGVYGRKEAPLSSNAGGRFQGRSPSTPADAVAPSRRGSDRNRTRTDAIGSEELESQHRESAKPIVHWQLPQDESSLRREYFLLVLSAQFCGMIIAHRPRSRRLSGEEGASGGDGASGDRARAHPLLALCSVDRKIIQRVLEGLRSAMQNSSSKVRSDSQTTVEQSDRAGEQSISVVTDVETLHATSLLLANWDALFTSSLADEAAEAGHLAHYASLLWAKQIQQQEEIRRSAMNYRASATEADALHLQNEELLEAMHLKDEFLSNVGQALRTPLTNMKTALSLLSSPNLKAAQRERYLQLLNTECDRQTSLINGMLDLVRLDRVTDRTDLQSLRLSDIVPGVVSTYQPLAQEKGVMLAYTVPDDLPPITCLRPWLKQIVINLLDNAIKFTATGGQVWVKAKPQGDYIQLEFRDTGIGIPTNEIPKIFERFYRVRQAVDDHPGGAGLGLTIVQQLLLRCGGSISVNSKLGDGSNFKVLLPIYHTALAES